MRRSPHESALAVAIGARGLPAPIHEYQFMPPRLWRFDFAWPLHRVAVEVDGGQWIHGRHNRGGGFERDAEKFLAALLDGWRVLRVTPRLIKTGAAVQALAWLLRQESRR